MAFLSWAKLKSDRMQAIEKRVMYFMVNNIDEIARKIAVPGKK